MSITLYYHILGQPSRAVLALLRLGNLKFEGKVVDLIKGEQRSPDYKAINVFGTVPCLVDGEVRIGESNAMMSYLCEAYPREL